jgi:hypothetical protein
MTEFLLKNFKDNVQTSPIYGITTTGNIRFSIKKTLEYIPKFIFLNGEQYE